jgi:hypothetical protein
MMSETKLYTYGAMQEGIVDHETYYGQFVDERVTNQVVWDLSKERVCNSVDEHFNDIPLEKWDPIGLPVPTVEAVRASGHMHASTVSVFCSVNKAAARKIRAEKDRERGFKVRVEDGPVMGPLEGFDGNQSKVVCTYELDASGAWQLVEVSNHYKTREGAYRAGRARVLAMDPMI